ncbi:hypothetical protein [Streptomyces gilvus]|uniref:hypothetical protein n=1 Tax=Streptomyces gilvus TaxID=2920937 RepID=UPI001F111A43|nr:hypothetical protein [Streptomyces sp. CME 23]MCH5677898.1 hypothetical protein [Streptomyces sp. CME 23]
MVDDQGGTNPGGVFSARHSVVSDEPPISGPFGIITNADSQPCARLLSAIGYGVKAPTADAWAEIGMVGPGGASLLEETVAAYPRGVAAEVVSDVAAAGSTCRAVSSRRANGAAISEPKSLIVPRVGDSSAGIEWPASSGGDASSNVLAVVQVGNSVIQIQGTLLSSSKASEFDRTLLDRAMVKAVARLRAAS